MSYILMWLMIAILPIVAGYAIARERPGGASRRLRMVIMVFMPLIIMAAWFALSRWARGYAETDVAGWEWAAGWAHSGKWIFFSVVSLFFLGMAFRLEITPVPRRRFFLCMTAVLLVVWIGVWRTIPVYTFLPRTSTRDADGLLRQTIEYTCGPVALATLMEKVFGMTGVTERELSQLSNTTCEGTTMNGLIRAAKAKGLRVAECRTMTLSELEALAQPAIVSISTIPSVRHATLLVASTDDRVRFLDPGYGRWEITRDRFAKIWYGKTLILAR